MTEGFCHEILNSADFEDIFREILDSPDGDYVIQAIILTAMKPAGW